MGARPPRDGDFPTTRRRVQVGPPRTRASARPRANEHATISCCWAAAAIVANSGTATLPLALPAGPWKLGRNFVAQAITFDAQGAFQNLLTLSNGLRVALGRR